MKNIHVLPTDNPSRLRINPKGKLILSNIPIGSKGETQNIYITNDEEIKFNDYVIQVNFEKTNTQVIQCVTEFQVKIVNDKDGSFTKNKIILTTDQNLIKDGVQAIDDEFLEWFVKNPSCERVEVDIETELDAYYRNGIGGTKPIKIIIPKEESKQELERGINIIHVSKPKQETLEEASKIYSEKASSIKILVDDRMDREVLCESAFESGAKWQAERSYSEEEVHSVIESYQNNIENNPNHITYDKWFEQFKKK